jgi:hypothetical protein
MLNFTSTQALAKELSPPVRRREARVEATEGNSTSTSPPLTANGLERMYHQLAEIHAIAAAQLVECARWRRSDSTRRLVRLGASHPRPDQPPSRMRPASSPLSDLSSQAPPWQWWGCHNEPQAHSQTHSGDQVALLTHSEQSPRRGGHSKFLGSTLRKPQGIAT